MTGSGSGIGRGQDGLAFGIVQRARVTHGVVTPNIVNAIPGKAVLTAEAVVRELDIPTIAVDEVLVRSRNVGICHSDFELYEGRYIIPVSYPIIPGHEWSGEIAEVARLMVDAGLIVITVIAIARVSPRRWPAGLTTWTRRHRAGTGGRPPPPLRARRRAARACPPAAPASATCRCSRRTGSTSVAPRYARPA